MYYDYFHIAVLLVVGVLLVYGSMVAFSLVRPKKPGELKNSTYECGIEAFGSSWIRFDMRFYAVALIFVIFDLEIAFLFPWAAVFRELGEAGSGTLVVIEGLIFVLILFLGLIYVWAKGDFDWVKAFAQGESHFAREGIAGSARETGLTEDEGIEADSEAHEEAPAEAESNAESNAESAKPGDDSNETKA